MPCHYVGAAMRRRDFISLLSGAAAIPFVAHAQQSERMRSIGVLLPASPDDPVFLARLKGWVAWAGTTVGTEESRSGGPRPIPAKFAKTRRKWSHLSQT